MSHSCINPESITKQGQALQFAISEHKWYLSEREHRDIGWEAAEEDFFNVYFKGFAAGWRICCCVNCKYNKDCSIGSKYYESINSEDQNCNQCPGSSQRR